MDKRKNDDDVGGDIEQALLIHSWDEFDNIFKTGKRVPSKLEPPRIAVLFTVVLFFVSGILFTTKKIAFSPAAKAAMIKKDVDYFDNGNGAIYASVKSPSSSTSTKISGPTSATSATSATASASHSFTYAADVDSNEEEKKEGDVVDKDEDEDEDEDEDNDKGEENENEEEEDEEESEIEVEDEEKDNSSTSTESKTKQKTTHEFGH